jgi:hypothetical protein
MVWYKPGIEREILVYVGQSGSQSILSTQLSPEDLTNPTVTLMAGGSPFFVITDNTLTCGENSENESQPFPLTRASMGKVPG